MTDNEADTSKRRHKSGVSRPGIAADATVSTGAMFAARGFSFSTIRTLVIAGVDAGERLLFAREADLL
jgi:hypothetical protein